MRAKALLNTISSIARRVSTGANRIQPYQLKEEMTRIRTLCEDIELYLIEEPLGTQSNRKAIKGPTIDATGKEEMAKVIPVERG